MSALQDAQRLHLEANKAEMAGHHDAAQAFRAQARTLEALAEMDAGMRRRSEDGSMTEPNFAVVWNATMLAVEALSEAQDALFDAREAQDRDAALQAATDRLLTARDHIMLALTYTLPPVHAPEEL